MADLIGKSFGRYRILEQLGEGGMATVYKAHDTRLESEVAVKVIRTERLSQEILQRALKRFEREAKTLAQLTHPNLVKVLDYGEYEERPYLVMPYLPGGTLKQKLQGQPMAWQEAARLLIPIARALEYAHKHGLIHRDIKPSNILITESGEPILTDFGIAKIIDEEVTLDLTGTSATVGTPEYMAPEQVTSRSVDQRADIYALGVVLYEMVTGRRPFQADTPMGVLFKHASEPLPRPSQFVSGLPDVVEKVLLKALAKKPADRYQSMEEVVSALDSFQTGATSAPKPPRLKKERLSVSAVVPPSKRPGALWLGVALLGTVIFATLIGLLAKGKAAQIFSIDTPLPTDSPVLTNSPLPTSSSVPTPGAVSFESSVPTHSPVSSTPTLVPWSFVTANVSINCRSGPGIDFPILTALEAGKSAPLYGKSENDKWGQIESPATAGERCWVSRNMVTLESGDWNAVPTVSSP